MAVLIEQQDGRCGPWFSCWTIRRLEVDSPRIRVTVVDDDVSASLHAQVRRVLTVLADPNEVRVVDGGAVLACHRRSYDCGEQIEQADHVAANENRLAFLELVSEG
jgi:hypothetical protein